MRLRIGGRLRGVGFALIGIALTPLWLVTALRCSSEEFDALMG